MIVVDWVADEASPGAVRFITSRLQTSQNRIDLPITDIGAEGGVRTIGREVTGVVDDRKLFWQPLLSRWPAE